VLPADARDPAVEWQQALSLAACLQEGPVLAVRDPEQLDALVEEMTGRLELPMLIYLEVLARGPASMQLRAAFHIGLAHIALSTRARGAIAAPPDLATNEAAALRYRELHARLEPLLVRSRRAAWLSFTAVDEAVAANPALASDAVARHMIRTAREMLAGLRDVARGRAHIAARTTRTLRSAWFTTLLAVVPRMRSHPP
jgi:hypothetical protein